MSSEEAITLTLTPEDVRLMRAAVQSMLEDFGHDEADVLRALKTLLAKIPAVE